MIVQEQCVFAQHMFLFLFANSGNCLLARGDQHVLAQPEHCGRAQEAGMFVVQEEDVLLAKDKHVFRGQETHLCVQEENVLIVQCATFCLCRTHRVFGR